MELKTPPSNKHPLSKEKENKQRLQTLSIDNVWFKKININLTFRMLKNTFLEVTDKTIAQSFLKK